MPKVGDLTISPRSGFGKEAVASPMGLYSHHSSSHRQCLGSRTALSARSLSLLRLFPRPGRLVLE